MMICHDDIDTERLRMSDGSHVTCTTVDSDHERDSLVSEFVEHIGLEPIAIMDSMREAI